MNPLTTIIFALGLLACAEKADTGPALQSQARPALEQDRTYEKGRLVFREHCQACHSISASDSKSAGQKKIGPDLNLARKSQDATAIRESIIDPDRSIRTGFPKGIMPVNFSRRLDESQLDAVVYFVANEENQ